MDLHKKEVDNLKRIVEVLAKTFSWKDERLPSDYLTFDLETLGFSATRDAVIQIGYCLVRNGEFDHTLWDEDYKAITLKWPEERFEKAAGAIEIHGIDFARSNAEGVDPLEVFTLMAELIKYGNDEGLLFCGHNLFAFDYGFIKTAMSLQNVACDIPCNSILDTAMLVKAMQLGMIPGIDESPSTYYSRVKAFRARGTYFNLDRYCVERFELAERYGVSKDNAHDAGYDCYMTSLVVKSLNLMLDGEW